MGRRKKSSPEGHRYEPIKVRVLMTETGYPAHISLVRDCYGPSAMPAAEDGWFWVFATPKSAANIRRRGLQAKGTLTMSFAPVQDAAKVYDTDPAWVPVVGSIEHTVLMLEETKSEREAGLLS